VPCALALLAAAGLWLADGAAPAAPSGPGASRIAAVAPGSGPFAVGLRVLHLTDASRRIRLPGGGTAPRTLTTYVRYPALGPSRSGDQTDAPASSSTGPFPLIVFGHGFDVTPAIYARMLRAWAQAGFVVAAPVFPLANPAAPGGPTEADLINQPRDMSFVISTLEAQSATAGAPLQGLIDPARIAVAGQSDGGITAFAAAFNSRLRDRRVRAAVILSGAELSGAGGSNFPAGSPPLLVTQGTADPINPHAVSERLYARARRPKFLLRLLGAGHLPPYTSGQPQLGIVERVTTAFLDLYLEQRGSVASLRALGAVQGAATLAAAP
jgi:dienelactone hydrolase